MQIKLNDMAITNSELNRIKLLANTLPKFQLKDKQGNKMFRRRVKRVLGKDLPEEYKKNNDWQPMQYYTIRYDEPTLVNHVQNMLDIFKKDGWKGVEGYQQSAVNFYEKNYEPKKRVSLIVRFFRLFKKRNPVKTTG